MAIGINDDDIVDDLDDVVVNESNESNESNEQTEPTQEENEGGSNQETDFLSSLLKSRGIEDKSKIKFENEDGEVEEVDWDSLSNDDKLNILETSKQSAENDLDESEIQLINAIRQSGMNPSEYLQYLGNNEVQRYIQNNQEPQYEIDQYSDDELFLMDFISRMGDVSDEEAEEALAKAKSNESLYQKQINAIRNEYKEAENENNMQAQFEQEQIQQQQYQQFSDQIVDEINNLTEIQGFDLNMEDNDMQMLYDFITGQDAAGNNYLAKALSDPKILVKTAWLALNGDQMINDITNYFQKEISNVRKESYKKGVEDTQNKMKTNNVVYKEKSKSIDKDFYNDLDDF